MAGLKRTLIPLAVAVVAALGAMTGLESVREAPTAPLAELAYNAYSEGVELRFHDVNGVLTHSLQAVSQTRFKDDSIEWSRPALRWFAAGESDWQVEAEHGFLAPSGDSLRLRGDVVVQQGGASDTLRLTTSALEIDLDASILSGNEPVRMVAGGLRQDAAGLVLNLPQDSLLMLGGVRGNHVRP